MPSRKSTRGKKEKGKPADDEETKESSSADKTTAAATTTPTDTGKDDGVAAAEAPATTGTTAAAATKEKKTTGEDDATTKEAGDAAAADAAATSKETATPVNGKATEDKDEAAAPAAADKKPAAGDKDAPRAAAAKAKAKPKKPYVYKPRKAAKKKLPWNDMLFQYLQYQSQMKDDFKAAIFDMEKMTSDLESWCQSQRWQYSHLHSRQYDKADPWLLTDERIKVLNFLEFTWKYQTYQDVRNEKRWNERYKLLVEYKEEHGHCNVPQGYKEKGNLGKWVKAQRDAKKAADKEEKEKAAAATTTTAAGKRKAKSEAAEDGKEGDKDKQQEDENKDEENEEGPPKKKNRGAPPLSQERQDLLNAIGFEWRRLRENMPNWEERYQQLCEYKEVNGDCLVPQSYPPDRTFGKWVMKQRCEFSQLRRGLKNTMTQERQDKLNAIGFVWVARAAPSSSPKKKPAPTKDREVVNVDDEDDADDEQQPDASAQPPHPPPPRRESPPPAPRFRFSYDLNWG